MPLSPLPAMSLNYASIQTNKWRSLPPPPGFAKTQSKRLEGPSKRASESYAALKEKRAWDVAIAPAKQLPMQFFMLYMSGSTIQIFSIGILVMLLFSPFTAVSKINSTFAPYAPDKNDAQRQTMFLLQKLAFVACNIATLALGLWKCRQVGLLPQGTGDWLPFETRGEPPELFLS